MRRLLIRPGAIGDCIVSLPALERLRAEYTEVWVADANVPLIRFADRVQGIQSSGLNLVELGLAPETLLDRLRGFDEIVSWYGEARAEFREAVRELPFRFHAALPRDAREHAVDFYLRQVGGPPGGIPTIPVERWEGGYAVIHPFSGSASKNWPLEKYRELARRLSRRIEVQWCAGPEDALADAIRSDDLYEVARRLAGARLYIGNDSGITHLAAAVETPVVALFGETDPAIWGPRGGQVKLIKHQRLEDLEIDRVAVTCEEMIAP